MRSIYLIGFKLQNLYDDSVLYFTVLCYILVYAITIVLFENKMFPYKLVLNVLSKFLFITNTFSRKMTNENYLNILNCLNHMKLKVLLINFSHNFPIIVFPLSLHQKFNNHATICLNIWSGWWPWAYLNVNIKRRFNKKCTNFFVMPLFIRKIKPLLMKLQIQVAG